MGGTRLGRVLLWLLQTLFALLIGVAVFMAAYVALTQWRPELRTPPLAWGAAGGAVVLAVAVSLAAVEGLSAAAHLVRSWRPRGTAARPDDGSEGS
jgi:hypothetical protein